MRYGSVLANHKVIVALFILAFVVVRSIHFADVLNFSTDQATFSTRALELWENKELTLVGPTASFGSTDGRFLIQSSIIYYTTLLFMAPVGFDPVAGSYLFMLVAASMVWFLYSGVLMLSNQKTAVFVTTLYVFMPFYIRFTQFLWNPNYQLAFTPALVWLLARYSHATQRKLFWLFGVGVMTGFLLLYHYQMVVFIAAFFVYLLSKKSWKLVAMWLIGLVTGMAPLIAFELNSHFYLSKTVLFMLSGVGAGAGGVDALSIHGHYVGALSLLLLVFLGVQLKAMINKKKNIWAGSCIALFIVVVMGSATVLKKPSHAYGMAPYWNYTLEQRAYELLRQAVGERGLENYAVANTLYDTLAPVTYFQIKRDGVAGWTQNYRENRYLFVISAQDGSSLENNPAYEMTGFEPSVQLDRWQLSDHYALFLLERK